MKLIQLFDEVLDSSFKVQPDSNGIYYLKESSIQDYPDTKLKKEGKAFVYKFDVNGRIFPFFDHRKPFINKSSDYIIFNQKENALFVFVIELKSKSIKKAYQQLFASEKFVDFIYLMAEAYRRINNIPIEGSDDIAIRHIISSFKNRPRPKTNVKGDNKYDTHPNFDYKYIHQKVGIDLFLENLCT